MSKFDERTTTARQRPWRVSCAGGRILGTFGSPETAFGRARDFAATYGHVWVRHRRWTTRAEAVTVNTQLGASLLNGGAFRPELHLFDEDEAITSDGQPG